MTGQIDILNVGLGHNEIRVDKSNPIELERGKRIIQDMLKRGYALFVHGEGDVLIRIEAFDPEKAVYIIGAEATLPAETEVETVPAPPKKGRPKKLVPMAAAKVTAVGRSAGG